MVLPSNSKMSCLVNYGSSDESDSSDGEDCPPVAAKPKEMDLKTQDTKKSSLFAALPKPKVVPTPSSSIQKKSSLFAALPKPKGVGTPAMEEVMNTKPSIGSDVRGAEGSRKNSLFSSLPPPKKTASTTEKSAEPTSGARHKPAPVATSSSTNNSTVSKGLLNLPPPKKKQPVKISLPALPDPNSDDDEPETKRPKSTKGVGLFAMLPKPRIASRREAQRPLIPYTLTKKPAAAPAKPPGKPPGNPLAPVQPVKPTHPSASTVIKSKPTSGNPLVMGYNSDEDDEEDDGGGGVNFFSMGESDHVKERTTEESATGVQSKPLAFSKPRIDASITESDIGTSRITCAADPGVVEPVIPTEQDQPLVFNPSQSNNVGFSVPRYNPHALSNPQYNVQSHQGSNYAQPNDGSMPYGSYNQTGLDSQEAMQYYNQPYQEGGDTGYGESGTSAQGSSQSVLQDEGFAKMVGKNNRGREEIQFIDINADDQIGPTASLQNMVKSMTEEKESRVKLKKEQLPTSQQKRKHQITYLARQAKERELELKNQWADNRATRKSQNAKYGFF
ncbi:proline-rich protein PRCC [Strongylocentrotus purpuratus]|uniref:Proline-rich protein PRCC n=1 Tax=Strongylocentrotus purpuratus TaxID=7668 RepID=A0A7M7N8E2_STRPU|nr:proline-rich protein PRCC [Strongylocentrotus purpuratus]